MSNKIIFKDSIKTIVSSILTLIIFLYSGMLGPQLPPVIINLFKNPIFKIIILFLFIYLVNDYDPRLIIMIVIAYVLTLEFIYVSAVTKVKEDMDNNPELYTQL
uniref:Uncharacterized protein n=1 Tax=viral metagenome TaxID=1070528 RepID=A0A6C0H7W2_9ZZZZ